MLFTEVIGQEACKQRLRSAIQSGKISHAQLFTGNAGVGTLALALAFVQYLYCTGEKGEDACGVCPSCKKMQKLIHPDVHFVFPIVKSAKIKNPVSDEYLPEWRQCLLDDPYPELEEWIAAMGGDENAQALIYTEESGNILKKLSLKSFESEYKTMLIWLPEMMKTECANKLLKILEEPYPNTLFILMAEKPEQILNTILSRTQQIHIPPLKQEEMSEALIAREGLSREKANEFAHLSKGNWAKARKLLHETEQAVYNQEKFTQLMRLCWSRKMLPVNQFVDELTLLGRERQKNFLTHCIRMIRENFIANLGIERLVYMSEREAEFSQRFAPYIREENVLPLYEEFEKAHYDILRNGNGKIIFTDLCIKVMQNIRP